MFSEWSKPYQHLDDNQPRENVLTLRFRQGAVLNERLTGDGKNVYDRVFQVEIAAIGQTKSKPVYEIEREVGDGTVKRDPCYKRFKRPFEAYRENIEPAMSGTPLEHWPLMGDLAIVRTFKDAAIHTVEALADMSDSAHESVRAKSREWQAKAKAWLSQQAGNQQVAQAGEVARLKELVEQQQSQIQELLAAQNMPRETPQPRRQRREAPADIVSAIEAEPPEARL